MSAWTQSLRTPNPGKHSSTSCPTDKPSSAVPSGDSTEMRPEPSACPGYTSFTSLGVSTASSRYLTLEFIVTTSVGTFCAGTVVARASLSRNRAWGLKSFKRCRSLRLMIVPMRASRGSRSYGKCAITRALRLVYDLSDPQAAQRGLGHERLSGRGAKQGGTEGREHRNAAMDSEGVARVGERDRPVL